MKKNDLYRKTVKLSQREDKTYSARSLKQIIYSSDARDFGQVAKSIPCQAACPAATNIPGYIRCIYEKRYGRAYELNRICNILPGVLGRICSRPCEQACRHGSPDEGDSVAICHLKRACADLKSPMHRIIEGFYAPSGKSVAVVGSGPAGLAAAHELTLLGHRVSLYESEKKPGGMLMYGIPEFRLPRDILMLEIENILRLGVTLKTGTKIGKDISLESLSKDHDAVVVTAGCTAPRSLGIEGENLEQVYNGLDFMKAVNAGEKPFVGNKVLVIGGGFTAVDCARSSVRLGASDVRITMRKTVEYMRVDEHEKHEADFEGIRTQGLVQPKRIVSENGKVTGMELYHTKMEYMDRPPWRTTVPIENSEFFLPADSVIAALGQTPSPANVSQTLDGSDICESGCAMEGLFAAGDFVTGSSDVITAIAGGRRCAHSVDGFLTGKKRKETVVRLEPHESTDRSRSFDFIPLVGMNTLDLDERMKSATAEVESGFTEEQAEEEAKRCYLCNLKYEIDPLSCIYCSACIDVAPKDCIKMIAKVEINEDGTFGEYRETRNWNEAVSIAIDNERCIRCGQCVKVCPMDCISVTKTELIELDIEE
ncbi:MAG: FAD-dependent oxidoreductase [Desulfarculaceae bacterium]|nr:FAD-dependent oxidoreductase [Desulfarculaceae bacterium]